MSQQRRQPEIARLHRAVKACEAARRTRPSPNVEMWLPVHPIDLLAPEDWTVIWDVARYLREHHPRTFNKYLSQWTIADIVVDYLGGISRAPTAAQLAKELDTRAKREPRWLVDVSAEPPTAQRGRRRRLGGHPCPRRPQAQ